MTKILSKRKRKELERFAKAKKSDLAKCSCCRKQHLKEKMLYEAEPFVSEVYPDAKKLVWLCSECYQDGVWSI